MPKFEVGDAVRVKSDGETDHDGQTGKIKNVRTVERGSGPMPAPENPLPPTREVTVYDVELDGGESVFGLEEDHLEPFSGDE